MKTPSHPRPDYGIDAPGVRRGMLAVGTVGLLVVALASRAAPWAGGLGAVAAAYGLGMAGYMTRSSRVGKLRTRERLLDLVVSITPWTGCERVLDVGCGRGLLAIGAARRLPEGEAVGVDLWRAEDQSSNRPDATLENARLEGVADRVRVETGDMRALPFADASFDAVLSHWAVHNVPDATDRMRALDEMVRVLRPGGALVLADIAHLKEYRAHLAARGLRDLRLDEGGIESRVVGFLSGGGFRPQVVAGRRP